MYIYIYITFIVMPALGRDEHIYILFIIQIRNEHMIKHLSLYFLFILQIICVRACL